MLYLLLILFSCKEAKSNLILKPNSDSAKLELHYGKKWESKEIALPTEWGPVLKNNCFSSHSDFYKKEEYGLVLEFCLGDDSGILAPALYTFYNQDKTSSRQSGIFLWNEKKVEVSFKTLSEIRKMHSEFLIIWAGDKHLTKEILEENISKEKLFSKDLEGNLIQTSFSLPYFSLFLTRTRTLVAFPSINIKERISSSEYLVLDFKENIEASEEIFEKFQEAIRTSAKFQNECKKMSIDFTEYVGSGSVSTKKFLEFKNTKNDIVCLSGLEFEISGKKFFPFKNGYLFPNATTLLLEEGSKLEGETQGKEFWKEISNSEKIFLKTELETNSFELPKRFSYISGDDEFSFKKNFKSCSDTIRYSERLNICADPGVELSQESQKCNLGDFYITELNPLGYWKNGRLDPNGKFIELQFNGEKPCDLSSVTLKIDSDSFPLSSKKEFIQKSEVIVVGRKDDFIEKIRISDRNISSVNIRSKIEILSGNDTRIIFSGIESDWILKGKTGALYSIVFENGKFFHHPKFQSKKLNNLLRQNHFMSPGEIVSNGVLGKASLVEVNVYGSYSENSSFSGDRFIELKNENSGTLEINITNQNEDKTYFIPIEEDSGYTVLSKENFQCYTNVSSIQSSDLILSRDTNKILVKSKDNSQEFHFKKSNLGKDSRTPRVRSSIVQTSIGTWKEFSEKKQIPNLKPECVGYSFASPNSANHYDPFLHKEGEKLFLINTDNSESITLKRFQVEPSFSEEISIQTQSNKQDISYLRPNREGLVYLEIKESGNTEIFSNKGLKIEAVSYNPSLSSNEWILLCNRGESSEHIHDYEIEDTHSKDLIIPYSERFVGSPPSFIDSFFAHTIGILQKDQCGYLVDPNFTLGILKPAGVIPTLLFTVSGSTNNSIGNGLSIGESIDLYKKGSPRIHIHSFGHRYSSRPVGLSVAKDEIIILNSERSGFQLDDYRIEKW
ncbi:MAG: hypothetical protein SFU98_18540 [Leptospiraceae bacterium]|nr:hypothetical protein [Leptospiraceae bacterium]